MPGAPVTSLDCSDDESRLSLELVRDTLALRTIQQATHWDIAAAPSGLRPRSRIGPMRLTPWTSP